MMKKILALALMTASATMLSSAAQSEPKPYIGDDLELTVDSIGTHFTLWSPMAEEVKVSLYRDGMNGEPYRVESMKRNDRDGVWRFSFGEQLLGDFYTFKIKSGGEWLAETPGVWAKAVGVNGLRGAIIDFDRTNPKGWSEDRGPKLESMTDAIIYEMHHRDFSIHENSGIANKGKFIALTEEGARSENGEVTGIDHLKELGITHVHILPSYDYNSVDETQLQRNTYNWGYDPVNYNVPEGSYSTNPSDPEVRIREFKEMVQALHNEGIGVILDVVYNHTALGDESNFSLTAPEYYYRYNRDGSYSNASGCGNETASEREQMRNYIVESVKYWAEEYHIDGFRFDLMAIHDIETMNRVAKELKEINPSIIIYGEGWTAADSPLPVKDRALKEHVSEMEGVAVFSDDIRNGIKGHHSRGEERGFATGGSGYEQTVMIGIVGATEHPQVDFSKGQVSTFPYATSPEQIINYVSCHDDLNLTDKLKLSMKGNNENQLISAAKLAQTIVFTSQGTPFIFTGEEIFRDKKGIHNTYNSPDEVNAIDWNQKSEYKNLFNYYQGLIAMRKAHPAFRMRTAEEIAEHIVFDEVEPNLIAYTIKGSANGDSWKTIKVIFNGSYSEREVKVKRGNWKIAAQGGEISADATLGTSRGGKVKVAPLSATILVQE